MECFLEYLCVEMIFSQRCVCVVSISTMMEAFQNDSLRNQAIPRYCKLPITYLCLFQCWYLIQPRTDMFHLRFKTIHRVTILLVCFCLLLFTFDGTRLMWIYTYVLLRTGSFFWIKNSTTTLFHHSNFTHNNIFTYLSI